LRARSAPRAAARSQRDVPVLLGGQARALRAQYAQRAHDLAAGLRGLDDRVDVAALGREPRADDLLLVLRDEPRPLRLDVPARGLDRGECATLQDVDRPARAHDSDLGGGPREVDVRAELL